MSKYDSYNPDWVANYYDEYGDREWTRFARTPADEVSLFLHTHHLERFVEPGSRVLEVGAGPGRFTKIMAELGCRVLVADISQVQLDLHRKHAEELGFEDAVEERLKLDICDMRRLSDESFDAVVCYGGAFELCLRPSALCIARMRTGLPERRIRSRQCHVSLGTDSSVLG